MNSLYSFEVLESRYYRIYNSQFTILFTSATRMPPKCQVKHLKDAREHIVHPQATRLDAKRFAFSVLIEGLNYASLERCLLWNDVIPPSTHLFYDVQHEIIPILVAMAQQSCQYWRSMMTPGTILSMDGSWSHRRNANRCLVDFVDSEKRKIVDFEIVVKRSGRIEGNYTGPSNGMEREALSRLIPRWKDDPRVVGYCHDNDGKTRRTIAEAGWQIDEYLDRNHIMHSFDKAYSTFAGKKLLWGLKEHLRRWMLMLICEDITLEKKKFYWEVVTVEHYTGCHTHCPRHGPCLSWSHSADPVHIDALRAFLAQTSKYLDKCNRLLSTQMNESLHALKAHYANKLFCWGGSWTARVCVALLDVNEPSVWRLELYNRLGFPPLDDAVVERLLTIAHSEELERELRRTPEFRKRENARRKKRKASNKRAESQCSDYTYHAVSAAPENDDSEEETSESEQIAIEQACEKAHEGHPEAFSDDEQDQESDDHLTNAPEGTLCNVA